mgnify:CR=1 FL=1
MDILEQELKKLSRHYSVVSEGFKNPFYTGDIMMTVIYRNRPVLQISYYNVGLLVKPETLHTLPFSNRLYMISSEYSLNKDNFDKKVYYLISDFYAYLYVFNRTTFNSDKSLTLLDIENNPDYMLTLNDIKNLKNNPLIDGNLLGTYMTNPKQLKGYIKSFNNQF